MMKKTFSLLILLILLAGVSRACELKFNISGEKKEGYSAGAELIIEVTVVYTHRTCEIQLSDTKFTYEGIKILGATPWKEKSPASYVRQIKVLVLEDSLDEGILSIGRKCTKEGAFGSIKLKKVKKIALNENAR
jgi:hypothetical protein